MRGKAMKEGINPNSLPAFGPGPPREEAQEGIAGLGPVVTGRKPAHSFRFREDHFLTHIKIDGSTGGGKTALLTHLSLQVHQAGKPVWWFDTEGDVTQFVVAAAPDVLVLSYKDLRLELFNGPETEDLDWQEYLSKLINTFRFTIWFGDGMSNLARDISIHLRETQGSFTLFDFNDELLRRKFRVKYREAEYWAGLNNRFGGMIVPLLGMTYGSGSHDVRALMGRSVVWQLHGLSDDLLAFWTTVLMLWVYLVSEIASTPELKILLAFDEFTRVCNRQRMQRQDGGESLLLDFVRTCRKRQIGMLLATQTPHLLPRVVLSNANSWVVFRPTDGYFLRCVSGALDLDAEQQHCLMELPDRHPRRALVRCPGCPEPFLVEIPEL